MLVRHKGLRPQGVKWESVVDPSANSEAPSTNVTVLLADSTPLTSHLIADALRRDRALTINNVSGRSVLAEAITQQPDIAVLSEKLDNTPGKGFAVLRQLRAAVPKTRAIMLLDCSERDLVVEAFRSGARGVFSRNDSLKMLGKCVRKVHEGQLWVNGAEFECLLQALSDAPVTNLVDTQGANLLSKREEDVVRWLAEGLTNSEIAHELKLSENTIKNYLFRIYNKLGVSNRVEAVIYAAHQRSGSRLPGV